MVINMANVITVETEAKEVKEVAGIEENIFNPNIGFNEKVMIATGIANTLKSVLIQQHLYVEINGHKYITVDGWSVLGNVLGCSIIVEEVSEIETNVKAKFGYKARVSIKHNNDTLATCEAIAERNKVQKDRYAVYSMAQTRAVGKCFRLAFSWIVNLAGFKSTPFEEMPRV